MLAEVKMLPAHANHPVRYEAKLAYLVGASSLAQKYWPPTNISVLDSESVIPYGAEAYQHWDMR